VTPFVLLAGVHKQWSPTVSVGPLSLELQRGEIVAPPCRMGRVSGCRRGPRLQSGEDRQHAVKPRAQHADLRGE